MTYRTGVMIILFFATLPIYVLFFGMWKRLIKQTKDKIKKFCFAMCIVQPVVTFIGGILFSGDVPRWAAFALSPITALMCLPVLFGFYLERNKAYSFGEKGNSGAVILFIVLNAIVSAFLFSARYFSYDSSLSFLAENIVREISYPFIIAEVILTAVLIILAVRVRGKENISRRNTALTAIIGVSLIQSLIVTFIAINRISDVEYVTVMGYVVLLVLILYRLFKKEK